MLYHSRVVSYDWCCDVLVFRVVTMLPYLGVFVLACSMLISKDKDVFGLYPDCVTCLYKIQ